MKKAYQFGTAASVLLAVLFITSCKVSNDVVLPNMAFPQTYRDAPTDKASIAELPWKSFFGDIALQNLIADALEHNNDLQVAVKNLAASDLTLKQAKLENIPSVGLQVGVNTARPSDNSLNGLTLNEALNTHHIEDYTVAASLSWEADIWGKVSSRKLVALAAYLGTGEVRKALQTRIVSDISKGYYNLLMLDMQLGIARRNVALNDSTLSLIQLQYTAGLVTSLAVQQAKAQKLTAEALIPKFEQQITVQENALSILCGRLPGAITRDVSLSSLAVSEKSDAGIPVDLLSRRPDVKQAELEVSQSNAQVGYAKANMYPSLTITAQGGLDAFKASNWFNIPASLFGAVAGGITQPIFEKKQRSTLYKVAKVNRDKTVIQFRQSVLVAYGEVSDALVKLDKLKQEQELATERTSTLEQATHNSQALFKNGMATYLEVIIAQGNVLQSELDVASLKKARLDANVDLYRSLGGGWK
jgi:multidrug efflux system outer membrane protein